MKTLKLLPFILLISLSACKKWWGNDEEYNPYKDMTAKQLYESSKDAIAKKEYATASKRLEALESMYPFSQYAEKAQMDLVYAYYQNDDYPSAAATAQRFIHLYPRASNVDYAYYMKGLADFQQTRGVLSNTLPMDESWRDPGTQSQAYADFAALIQHYPNSRYKADALQRMVYLRNMFAKRELNIADYYFERKMYTAAAARASYLIKNYPQAPSVQQGMVLLYQSNKALGLDKAALDVKQSYEATFKKKLV